MGMRRKEREVKDFSRIQEFVGKTDVVRIAFFDEKFPYIVPVNFAPIWQGETLVLYIHGAKEGKKVELLGKNPNVAIEMDGGHELIEGKRNAAAYSYTYQSLIGFGEAEVIETLTEKKRALEKLMAHTAPHAEFDEIPEKMLALTGIIKITVPQYTMKENKNKQRK